MTEEMDEVLAYLRRGEWLRPMDIGGTDGSHHSRTLAKLVKRGLVERRKRNTITNVILNGHRGSYVYRITDQGEEFLKSLDEA